MIIIALQITETLETVHAKSWGLASWFIAIQMMIKVMQNNGVNESSETTDEMENVIALLITQDESPRWRTDSNDQTKPWCSFVPHPKAGASIYGDMQVA